MDDRRVWETRYNTVERRHPTTPNEYLRAQSHRLPPRGLALDLACGEGRNAVFLAEQGFEVVAVDIAHRALQKAMQLARKHGVSLHAVVADLQQFVIPDAVFDVIINFNYLQRSLAAAIIEGLRPGGVLIFETLTVEQLRWKPDFNPSYLLRPGELQELFRRLRVLDYRETSLTAGQSIRCLASLVARKE